MARQIYGYGPWGWSAWFASWGDLAWAQYAHFHCPYHTTAEWAEFFSMYSVMDWVRWLFSPSRL